MVLPGTPLPLPPKSLDPPLSTGWIGRQGGCLLQLSTTTVGAGLMFAQRDVPNRQLRTIPRPRASPDLPYAGTPVVVLANRAPFRHERALNGLISVERSGSNS
jgi:hypothetical protein